MRQPVTVVDLRGEAPARVQGAAFQAVRTLGAGESMVLLTAQDPVLMMTSLDLHLRHNLSWTIAGADDGWRVEVCRREDAAASDVLDVLERDHKRLDGLLVRAMQQFDRGEAGAAQSMRVFAGALKRHMDAEDRLLGPELSAPDDAPLAVMTREHSEIRQQLALIEECLALEVPDSGEAGAFSAILSGTLAKHEHREESNLFPLWRARHASLPAARRRELMQQVEDLLRVPANG